MKNNNQQAPLFFSMTYEFLETYLPKQCGRSPHTVESYRDALSLFRRYILEILGISIGKFTFGDSSRECLLGFMDYYLAKLGSKPSTRNQRLAALKSYMKFTADKDVTLQSKELEIRRIPQCKAPKTEKEAIPKEAMAALLKQPPKTKMGLRDRTIMILLYDTGTRLAEVLGLRVCDVTIPGDNPHIRVQGKGSKQRLVPLSVKTAGHPAQYISVYHGNEHSATALLFYTLIKGVVGVMSEGNVERFVKGYACKARGFCPAMPDYVHPHMFRRTRATELYQNGVSLPLVSRLDMHHWKQQSCMPNRVSRCFAPR
jgi:site-specific recombinase XerD